MDQVLKTKSLWKAYTKDSAPISTILHLSLHNDGHKTKSKNASGNFTVFCTVWTTICLATTGKTTLSKNASRHFTIFCTVWTISGTCQRTTAGT